MIRFVRALAWLRWRTLVNAVAGGRRDELELLLEQMTQRAREFEARGRASSRGMPLQRRAGAPA